MSPAICPILALALHVLSTSYRYASAEAVNRDAVFAGRDIESKYSKWLLRTLSKMEPHVKCELGISDDELGTHSARKGVATYVSSSPSGPSTINIFLRAGWSIGPVQQRYIFAGAGGDQYVGRCAAGLPITDVLFGALPPHFRRSSTESILSGTEWKDIVPEFDKYPVNFQHVIPYLIASVVFHSEWLRTNLPVDHPISSLKMAYAGSEVSHKMD